jgi:N-acetylmuramoyl-L-alanine amidase
MMAGGQRLILVFGMTQFKSFWAALAAMVLFVSVASAQQDGGLVSTSQLAKSLQMRHERDPLSGREVFTGERGEVVLCPAMSRALVNGKLVELPAEPRNLGGEVVIPMRAVCVIETMLVKPPDVRPDVNPPGRDVPPAVFKPVRVFKKVVIDPGHGGAVSGGATGRQGTKEKAVNLDIGLRMKGLLEAEGIEVVMTRNSDKELSKNLREDLQERVDLTNREQPDAFVSIHNNWISKKNIRGFELYVARDEDKKDRVDAAAKNPVWPASRAGCKKPAEASRVKSVCEDMYEQNPRRAFLWRRRSATSCGTTSTSRTGTYGRQAST